MSDIPYNNKMDPKTKAVAIIIVLLIIGLVVGLIISRVSIDYASRKAGERYKDNPQLQLLIRAFTDMYTLGTTIICINIFLLLGLRRLMTFRRLVLNNRAGTADLGTGRFLTF